MYTQVAYALAVTSGTEAVSQAVSVAGANAVGIDMTVINIATGNVNADLEGSNDLANWQTVQADLFNSATGITAVGYSSVQFPSVSSDVANARIGFEYLRLRYSQSSGTSIVSAGINTFEA